MESQSSKKNQVIKPMQLNTIACPSCGSNGHSVAAIYNKEYQNSKKEGTFSGSGLVLTTAGVGVGLSSGTYEERGENATKRAILFKEPNAPKLISFNIPISQRTQSSLHLTIFLIFICFIMNLNQLLGQTIHSDFNRRAISTIVENIFNLQEYVLIAIPFAGLLSFIFYTIDLNKDNSIEEKKIKDKNKSIKDNHSKKLILYNTMRYCETCNFLYDNNRNKIEPANNRGFQMMLSPS